MDPQAASAGIPPRIVVGISQVQERLTSSRIVEQLTNYAPLHRDAVAGEYLGLIDGARDSK